MKGNPGLPSDPQMAHSFEVQLERLMTATPDEKSSDIAANTSKLQLVTMRTPPNTPCHNGSELVTIRQLIELLESAFFKRHDKHIFVCE
jgi:hypothetical protein